MGSIIFLRHGHAKNNLERTLVGRTPGVPLTEKGINQAQTIANFLKSMNISKVYTSPIERAQKTAEIVAEHNSVDCKIDERLIELDMGKFTGLPYDEIFQSHGNVFLKFYEGQIEIAHNGVETFSEVNKRVQSMVDHVLNEHPNENIVLVTHMDPIKSMIASVMDLKPQSLFELIIANASLTIFREAGGKLSVKAINVMDPTQFDQEW